MHRTLSFFCLVFCCLIPNGRAEDPASKSKPPRKVANRNTKLPKIDKVVAFDTPEADAIVSALQILPPDSPWNQVIADWPLHPKSGALVASVGVDKVLRV